MFSVIIPTMWRSKKILSSVSDLINCNLISEIIIINNNVGQELEIDFNNDKIKLLNQKENIYVNPSWNLGVTTSTNEHLLFINDDVYIEDSCTLISMILDNDFDLIGFDKNNSNKDPYFEIRDHSGDSIRFPQYSTWFYMKKNKYVFIPEDILIWCGDGIQYTVNQNRGIFTAPSVDFEMSQTLKTIPSLGWILYQNDRPNYLKYCNENNFIPR
jgi:hypothetical protein